MSINRHLSRTIILQVLFEIDMNSNFGISRNDLDVVASRQIAEFANDLDSEYVMKVLHIVLERLQTIDDIIVKSAPEWPIEKINVTDRNILRLGLAELLFNSEEVPPKVAIDEAIELAKKYSGNASYKFINGVLGNIYKEMGEPRKDEKKEKKNYDNLETINLSGGLVFSIQDGKIFLAFIKDIFKHWTLPKGKLEKDEDLRVGAIRKIKEEIGLDVGIKDVLKENTYIGNIDKDKQGEKVKKHVTYFLAEGKHLPLQLNPEDTGITEVKWFSLEEVENLKMYDDIKPILEIGIKKILKIYENK